MNSLDIHTVLLGIVSTAGVGKIILMAARTMPPPSEKCGFWCRWFYDFMQSLGENPDLVGKVLTPNPTANPEPPLEPK